MGLRRLALFISGIACIAGCQSAGARAPAATSSANATVTGPAIPQRVPAQFPTAWRLRAGDSAHFAERAMIASNSRLASEAGIEIIRAGGNAVDAAVAVGFALAVTYPVAGNVGGGGYMVIRMADGRTAALDYREMAPLAASRDMYLDKNGDLTEESTVGYRASGVPGAVAGMLEALAKYGTKSRAEALAPALRLARDGFIVDSALSRSLTGSKRLIAQFNGRSVFYPNDSAPKPGTRFQQPALAATLQRIVDQGAKGFYEGVTADSLVAEMKRGGGLITQEDLRRYRAIWRTPIVATYRGYQLITMPPSSSGGTTIAESLNLLETFPATHAWGSASYIHLLGSSYQRAFIDRNSKLGDPDFVNVPVAQLTSKEYARALAKTIDPQRATPTPRDGKQIVDGMHTTHYSVVDDKGNAVATTTTINGGYGSGVYLKSVGFFMNNEMDDFAAAPGKPNMFGLVQGEQNAIQPGKRMLSAMSPTVVLDPKGELLMVAGAAGGPRIITTTSQVILNVIQHNMTLSDAMRAPRIHHQALPDELLVENAGLTPEAEAALKAMGHAVRFTAGLANANAVMRVRGGWHGVSEPRASGERGTAGY
ncbi:MAG TPA: gamma-glutamyltransferase [Gemmatimonadaceae bacterium]|nr:gamma-glutamyltransferase [Gemmatimonadaceae bacterium]